MRLRRYAGPQGCVLILDTGGGAPEARERGLLLCRSVTLGADGLLMGPLNREAPFLLQSLDADGLPAPLRRWEADAFARFLLDAGYAPTDTARVTDGRRCLLGEGAGWTGSPLEGHELDRMLSLRF